MALFPMLVFGVATECDTNQGGCFTGSYWFKGNKRVVSMQEPNFKAGVFTSMQEMPASTG